MLVSQFIEPYMPPVGDTGLDNFEEGQHGQCKAMSGNKKAAYIADGGSDSNGVKRILKT